MRQVTIVHQLSDPLAGKEKKLYSGIGVLIIAAAAILVATGLINPANLASWVMALVAVFTAMWTKLGDHQPTTPRKFGIALVLIGLAFLIFLLQAGNTNVNVLWLVLILFVCTLGELSISPVGTSLASKLAPEAHRVYMMALYFCSISMGTVLAGWLAQFYSIENEVPYFTALGLVSIVMGLLLFVLNKWIVKKMAGVR